VSSWHFIVDNTEQIITTSSKGKLHAGTPARRTKQDRLLHDSCHALVKWLRPHHHRNVACDRCINVHLVILLRSQRSNLRPQPSTWLPACIRDLNAALVDIGTDLGRNPLSSIRETRSRNLCRGIHGRGSTQDHRYACTGDYAYY